MIHPVRQPPAVHGVRSRPGCTTGCGNPACRFFRPLEVHCATQMPPFAAALTAPVADLGACDAERFSQVPVSTETFFFFSKKPGTTHLSMFCSGQRAVIHPVSQPLAIHGIGAGPGVPPAASIHPVSVLLEKKLFRTSQEILRQASGRHSHLCCLPVFHRASLISATSGPSGMLPSNETLSPCLVTHRHSSATLQIVLRFFQAGLGPQI